MSRKRFAGTKPRQQHEKPVDDNDMTPNLESETPETERIEDEGEPEGGNFA